MTMPFGFLICVLFKKCRNIKATFISRVCFSLIIELSQFIISLFLGYTYKITDIDDLILNSFGALLGFFIYKLNGHILS